MKAEINERNRTPHKRNNLTAALMRTRNSKEHNMQRITVHCSSGVLADLKPEGWNFKCPLAKIG